MKSLYLTLTFALACYGIAFGCSCLDIPTFCETIARNGGVIDSNYVIVHAKVESKSSAEMQIKVLTRFFGTPEGNVLTIPQGYGADCRSSIDHFDLNAEYIFALNGRSDIGYTLSICGVTYLNVSGNKIIGSIAPGINQIRITDFPTIDNCGGLGSTLAFIDVTPTLTSEDIHVSTTRDIEDIHIAMVDMLGRVVYSSDNDVLLESEPLVIQGRHFPSGCYAIVTEVAGIRRTFRVVILS